MEKKLIESKIDLFLEEIENIQEFIKNRWGSNILKRVIRGEIPRSEINIKNP